MIPPRVIDLGRLAYAPAFEVQQRYVEEVLAAREARGHGSARDPGDILPGYVLVVEHDPVVTVSRRASAGGNVLASAEVLARLGVGLEATDRGGDVTYHGPGQVVVYPILDLNLLGMGLHDHMRMLEESVIRALARWGVAGERDASATGVWVRTAEGVPAKVAAMGVRVRKWVTMHGLALNVRPNLEHFGLIVPCGLVGRPVTSLERIMGAACPSQAEAARAVVEELSALVMARVMGRA